jgi:hypothetical protein
MIAGSQSLRRLLVKQCTNPAEQLGPFLVLEIIREERFEIRLYPFQMRYNVTLLSLQSEVIIILQMQVLVF